MATILGRHKALCGVCDFDGVHVKRNEGKRPFTHCPQCGVVMNTKSNDQAAGLLARMRPQKIDQAALPQPPQTAQPIIVKADPAPAVAAPTAPPKKKASPWATLMDSDK
jgi:hypothetical protein